MSAADRRFEPLGGRTVYEGRLVGLYLERYRFGDGKVTDREAVRHPGAAAVVAHDEDDVFLVRQPREVIGDPDFLEVPAGVLDVEGESPLDAAKRELAEEVGKSAGTWERVVDYVSSPGVMDEVVHVFHATDLSDVTAHRDSDERIEVVRWPLSDLAGAIAATRDAKTLIGLLWLRAQRR